jgi:DNA-binding NarL/FixJ family response regulator
VLVVDDEPVLRRGLRAVLEEAPDLEVVAETGSGEEALTLCGQTRPDLVLLDLMLPGMSGLDAIRALHAAYPDVQLVVLTGHDDGALVREALQAGAIGYLLKGMSLQELVQDLRRARAGQLTVDPSAVVKFVQQMADQDRRRGQDLTTREREVLALLVKGWGNRQIAEQLVIEPSGVKFHLRNIRAKLHTSNRTETVAVALREHWIPTLS